MCSNVIYKYLCSGCSATYYGKTSRNLKIRCYEYLGTNKSGGKRICPSPSPVWDHIKQLGHAGTLEQPYQAWTWEHLFKNITADCILKRKVRTRSFSLPWLSLEVRKALNRRCKLLKKYKKTKDEEIWAMYKHYRNKVQKMLKKAEMVYWKDQFAKASNSKEFWQVVRKVNGKVKRISIPQINDGKGTMLISDLEKAESINEYFANIGKELARKFNRKKATSGHYYRVTPSTSSLRLTVEKVIRKLKSISQKTGGMDGIGARELAAAGEKLFEGLYGIYSRSINESKFPENWKTGQVSAAFKSGAPSERANYKPLTMPNLNSKVLEDLICDSIDYHTAHTGLIHSNQWAFQKGISTESLLLFLTETWKKVIDNSFRVSVLFIDFKKAFDTIYHDVLKAKLLTAGKSGAFHDWLSSYLSNRKQLLVINGMRSKTLPMDMGVPQGSLLGPRLFTLYVNDLPAIETAGTINMFADDTTIYYIGKEVEKVVDALNSISVDLYKWCQRNNLTLHESKTTAMLISGTPFIGPMREIK